MFESGVHEKPDLLEAFHERIWREVQAPGALTSPRKNEFGTIGDAIFRCLEELILALFLVDLLSRSHFPTHLSPSLFLCKFGRITRPIFSKIGEVRSARSPWLRQ